MNQTQSSDTEEYNFDVLNPSRQIIPSMGRISGSIELPNVKSIGDINLTNSFTQCHIQMQKNKDDVFQRRMQEKVDRLVDNFNTGPQIQINDSSSEELESEEEEKKNPDDTYSFDTEFVSITKFGWDQEGAKVKVYVTSGIDGVGSLDKNQIACDFKKVGPNHMMDLRIYGLNGANYRLKLP